MPNAPTPPAMPAIVLTTELKRELRQKAHHLPVLARMGTQGLTESFVNEAKSALEHHELIKVHLAGEDRIGRDACMNDLLAQLGATLIQRIGHLAVIWKPKMVVELPKKEPKISYKPRQERPVRRDDRRNAPRFRSGEERPRLGNADGSRPQRDFREKREFNADRPQRDFREKREFNADRPQRDFREKREFNADRPQRDFREKREFNADRPQRDFREKREFNADRPQRSFGDGERQRSSRPASARADFRGRQDFRRNDGEQRGGFGGEKREFNADRPRRDSFGNGEKREWSADRPERSFGGGNRPSRSTFGSGGERPQRGGDRPRGGGSFGGGRPSGGNGRPPRR